jgi:hypothetical protein
VLGFRHSAIDELRTPPENRADVERVGALLAAGFGLELVGVAVVVEAGPMKLENGLPKRQRL